MFGYILRKQEFNYLKNQELVEICNLAKFGHEHFANYLMENYKMKVFTIDEIKLIQDTCKVLKGNYDVTYPGGSEFVVIPNGIKKLIAWRTNIKDDYYFASLTNEERTIYSYAIIKQTTNNSWLYCLDGAFDLIKPILNNNGDS